MILCICVFIFSLYILSFKIPSELSEKKCTRNSVKDGMIGTIDQKCHVKYGEKYKYLVKKSYCCVTNQYDISNCKQK